MKLYTEEQVIEMINKSQATGLTADFLILTMPSIELPSDDEIVDKALEIGYTNNLFILGAKWMREQTYGGNK